MAKSKLDIAGRLSKVIQPPKTRHWLDKFQLAYPDEAAELIDLVNKHQSHDPTIRAKLRNDTRLSEFVNGILKDYGVVVKTSTVQKWLIDRRGDG